MYLDRWWLVVGGWCFLHIPSIEYREGWKHSMANRFEPVLGGSFKTNIMTTKTLKIKHSLMKRPMLVVISCLLIVFCWGRSSSRADEVDAEEVAPPLQRVVA